MSPCLMLPPLPSPFARLRWAYIATCGTPLNSNARKPAAHSFFSVSTSSISPIPYRVASRHGRGDQIPPLVVTRVVVPYLCPVGIVGDVVADAVALKWPDKTAHGFSLLHLFIFNEFYWITFQKAHSNRKQHSNHQQRHHNNPHPHRQIDPHPGPDRSQRRASSIAGRHGFRQTFEQGKAERGQRWPIITMPSVAMMVQSSGMLKPRPA